MIQVGHKINDFECDAYHDGEIKKIRLSFYEGKWLVLLFYPADFAFVCPTELEEAADHYEPRVLAALLLQIATINVWNRLNASTRAVAGRWG